jgi:hypothetical protein
MISPFAAPSEVAQDLHITMEQLLTGMRMQGKEKQETLCITQTQKKRKLILKILTMLGTGCRAISPIACLPGNLVFRRLVAAGFILNV